MRHTHTHTHTHTQSGLSAHQMKAATVFDNSNKNYSFICFTSRWCNLEKDEFKGCCHDTHKKKKLWGIIQRRWRTSHLEKLIYCRCSLQALMTFIKMTNKAGLFHVLCLSSASFITFSCFKRGTGMSRNSSQTIHQITRDPQLPREQNTVNVNLTCFQISIN